ncbi:MAG TPA: oligosaccharide flippase family protein [Acidobacteriaceae bacterium]|jgi:O-antigen/teichoic acid export membrane protein
MRDQISNALCGVLDYASYPIGMLLVAPAVLHKLGAAEYGIWAVATAAVSTGGIIAAGFGDAHIQHVARLREPSQKPLLLHTVRSMMGISLALGTAVALIGWFLSPLAAAHIGSESPALQHVSLISLRIASFLMLVRALESVSISTMRAFEKYGAAIWVSITARLISLAGAAILALSGYNTAHIMGVTAVVFVLSCWLQLVQLRRFLDAPTLLPAFEPGITRSLFDFGIYSWLQALAGVLFGQVDRLFLGVSMGAAAVASYALCTQLAQPIFGFSAATLHFLFPYLSNRIGKISNAAFARSLLLAFGFNIVLVGVGSAVLLLFGQRILQLWAGAAIAQIASPILPVIVLGSALLGLSVTGTYAMFALGHVRLVSWLSIAGGVLMLLLMPVGLHRAGIHGLALTRLCYGGFSLLLYIPLFRYAARKPQGLHLASAPVLHEFREGSQS